MTTTTTTKQMNQLTCDFDFESSQEKTRSQEKAHQEKTSLRSFYLGERCDTNVNSAF